MKPIRAAALAAPLALALSFAGSPPVAAQTLQEVEQREAALATAWESTPLAVRRAQFVTKRADLYGQFTPRASNVFRSGEALLTYVEPVGYTWKPVGADGFAFGLTLDFVVKSRSGEILGGQEKFLNYAQTSRHKVRELMVNITLNLSGAAPGDYVVEWRMRDDNSPKTVTFEQTFSIAR